MANSTSGRGRKNGERCYSRNRGPCTACQKAKRKCRQGNPRCVRCSKLMLDCEPSAQAVWRVATTQDLGSQQSPLTDDQRQSIMSPVSLSNSNNPVNTGNTASNIDHPTPAASEARFEQDSGRAAEPDTVYDPGQSISDATFSHLETSSEVQNTLVGAALQDQLFYNTLFSDFNFESDMITYGDVQTVFDEAEDQTLCEVYPEQVCATTAQREADLDAGIAIFESPIKALAREVTGSETAQINQEEYFFGLWTSFNHVVAPSLTAFGKDCNNPFLKYLVPEARKHPDLLTASLFFTQIMLDRSRSNPSPSEARNLEIHAEKVLEKLNSSHDLLGSTQSREPLSTLSILLVVCMCFIAKSDCIGFLTHAEHAIVICQSLFKTMAEEENFLYLAKLLGFMQISFLFTTCNEGFNAPDYLGAALELHLSGGNGTSSTEHGTGRLHFQDLDMFSGMSASIASIMYSLGTLVNRLKQAPYNDRQTQSIRSFETDVDGLEARLIRHISLLKKQGQLPPGRDTHALVNQELNYYNKAVLWSAWTIFLAVIKNKSGAEIDTAVESILDACAEIPHESIVAGLILFPLAVGGMRASKKVYREFVLNRLKGLESVCITDTRELSHDLQRWWSADCHGEGPIAFTASILF